MSTLWPTCGTLGHHYGHNSMLVGEFGDIGHSPDRPKQGDQGEAFGPDGDRKAAPSVHRDVSGLAGLVGSPLRFGSPYDGDKPPIPV